jgi:hypothetical protein
MRIRSDSFETAADPRRVRDGCAGRLRRQPQPAPGMGRTCPTGALVRAAVHRHRCADRWPRWPARTAWRSRSTTRAATSCTGRWPTSPPAPGTSPPAAAATASPRAASQRPPDRPARARASTTTPAGSPATPTWRRLLRLRRPVPAAERPARAPLLLPRVRARRGSARPAGEVHRRRRVRRHARPRAGRGRNLRHLRAAPQGHWLSRPLAASVIRRRAATAAATRPARSGRSRTGCSGACRCSPAASAPRRNR